MSRVSGSDLRGRRPFGAAHILLAGVLLAGGALAGTLIAEDLVKPAEKAFEKGVSDVLDVLKADIKAAEKAAVDELVSYEDVVGDLLVSPANVAATLADVIEECQTAVGLARYEASDAASWLGHSLLSGLEQADALPESYPETFLPGTRGAVDRLRETSARLAEKSATRLRKRLDHVRGVLLKVQLLHVAIRLEPAGPGREYSANPGIVLIGDATPLTVDFAVAVSSDLAVEDARMVAGGQADAEVGDVALMVGGADASIGDDATPDGETLRWRVTLDDGDDLFQEQNAFVLAVQGDGAPATLSIGMP